MAHRRGKKIATIAVARKLLARAYHLLTTAEQTPQPTPTRRASRPGSRTVPTPRSTTTGRGHSPGRARKIA
jgi:hypothetical protein